MAYDWSISQRPDRPDQRPHSDGWLGSTGRGPRAHRVRRTQQSTTLPECWTESLPPPARTVTARRGARWLGTPDRAERAASTPTGLRLRGAESAPRQPPTAAADRPPGESFPYRVSAFPRPFPRHDTSQHVRRVPGTHRPRQGQPATSRGMLRRRRGHDPPVSRRIQPDHNPRSPEPRRASGGSMATWIPL